MNRTGSTTVIAMAAGGLALLAACTDAPAPSEPAGSSPPASPSASPDANLVNVRGLTLRYPDGFTLYANGASYAQVIKVGVGPGDEGGMNLFAMDTVVDPQDGYVPAPADALAWLRTQENFTVEDLGKIQVSGQDVPVARVTSSNDGVPLACGPTATSADSTCFFTGKPGPVYGFVRVGERTIVVERSSLAEMEDWAPLLSVEDP